MAEEKEKRTDEELKEIAVDLVHGQIYSTQHQFLIDNPDMIPSVFMPLALMTPEVSKVFLARNPAMIFEYISKAGPRSINGQPGFFSFQYLDQEEYKKVMEYYHKLKASEAEVLKQ